MKALETNEINSQEIEESEIIERILSGEKKLYSILVKRNNQTLYRVIRSYIKDEADIEDVIQNSYIKAYTKLSQFKSASSFSTWLIRIAINESLLRIRQNGKRRRLRAQASDAVGYNLLEIPDSNQLNPQQKMIQKEAKNQLEEAIDMLSLKYQVVYLMREIEGMSIKEIALILNLTEVNVKVRLHRSKDMLKENLLALSHKPQVFEFGFSRCDRVTTQVMHHVLKRDSNKNQE